MSYEINIISVGQKQLSSSYQPQKLIIQNEIIHSNVNRYYEIWPVFSHVDGILYTLVQEIEGTEGFFWSYPLCDSDFEAPVSTDLIPNCVPEKAKNNLTPLIIYQQYYAEVENCVKMLVQDSPCKTILFQTRYQGGDCEIFGETLTINQFLERLKNRRILFNVCYIVTEALTP